MVIYYLVNQVIIIDGILKIAHIVAMEVVGVSNLSGLENMLAVSQGKRLQAVK
jgi:hypothetical protein